jgi:hypothetical protein
MPTTKATHMTYTLRGFEYEQTADGSWHIYKGDETLAALPTQDAVREWINEEKRKEYAAEKSGSQ